MKLVHLIDYGVGNIGSLCRMLEALGFIGDRTDDPETVRHSPLVLLPGVGSAKTAMQELQQRKLLEPIQARYAAGRAIVGICLGAQLPFTHLEEAEGEGLGLLAGAVRRLPARTRFNTGWCHLDWDRARINGFGTGLRSSDSYFFNHQYACPRPNLPGCITIAGEPDIPAIYFTPQLCGIQFHPEKSQEPGRLLMRNILRHYHGL